MFGPDDTRRAWAWAKPLRPVVVKPHNQNQGQGVHVGLTDRRAFSRAFDEVARAYGSVLVEQFATGTEHRVLVVDGRVVAATLRVPANVEGDGRSTVEQLVEQKNAERKTERGRVHKPLQLDGLAVAQLRRQKLHPGSVPGDGQRVYLRATSNIHTGGDAHDATDDLAPDEVALVERAAAAIPGLGLGGFDVLLPRQPGETDISILEVNPSPMVSMHHFPWVGQPRDAAGAILDTMFPATRPSPPAVDPIADQLDHDDRGDELCSSCGQANEIVFGSLDCVDCVEAGLVTQST